MKRLVGIAGAVLLVFALLVPVVLAAGPFPHTGRVIVSTGGDVTLPAGEHADVVVVVNGTATIQGEVDTIVAVDGGANLVGARVETVVVVRSPVELGAGTVVEGDVMTLDSAVHQVGNAKILGTVSDLASAAVGFGAVLGPALVLVWIGFGLAMVAAALLLAGLGARQVRDAETLMSQEPAMTLVVGIVGLFVFPIVAFLLITTVIGAPLGVALLLQLWPLVAFLGYLVAGIWVGEWVLRRTSPERIRERPYLAAVVGVLLLEVLALVPILGFAVMVASLFGFGAVIRLSFRTLRSRPLVTGDRVAPIPAAIAG